MPEPAEEDERGRYLAVRTGPTSIVIYRAVNLCETCQDCGCGDQQEPIDLSPAGIARLMSSAKINPLQLLGMAKAGKNGG